MGGLVRRDDPVAMERARQEVIRPAADRAVAEVHIAAHRTTRQVAETLVSETKAIQDDQVFGMVAPHAEATVEQVGNILLEMAEDASNQIRSQVRRFS
jgi:hypothetical protein